MVLLLLWGGAGMDLHAQHSLNWTFGDSILLQFHSGNPIVNPNITTTYFNEFAGTYSDKNGDLLLYVNHDSIYNKSGLTVKGIPKLGASYSNTQGALIIPIDSKENLLQLFFSSTGCLAGGYCLQTITIDVSMNNGMGGVKKNKSIIYENPPQYISEKLTAVKHANGRDWWIFTHDSYNDEFAYFLFTPNGLLGPFKQKIGSDYSIKMPGGAYPDIGEMVFSEQGDKLLAVTFTGYVDLFEFDRCTGLLSNFEDLGILSTNKNGQNTMYGASFSPDGSKLYVSEGGNLQGASLYQFDLNAPNIFSSKTIIHQFPPDTTLFGQHQIGPDGKIYFTVQSGTQNDSLEYQLGVLYYPDSLGLACGFNLNSVLLPRKTSWGLPNLPNYNLEPLVAMLAEAGPDTLICEGDSVRLGLPDTTSNRMTFAWQPSLWLSDPTVSNPIAHPPQTTTYYLSAVDTVIGAPCGETIDSVTVSIFSPEIFQSHDTLFASAGAAYQWFFNGNPIAGATQNYYVAASSGNYSVEVTHWGGCTLTSPTLLGLAPELETSITVFPNPSRGSFFIEITGWDPGLLPVSIHDLTGKLILKRSLNPLKPGQFELDGLEAGVHLLQIEVAGRVYFRKVVVGF